MNAILPHLRDRGIQVSFLQVPFHKLQDRNFATHFAQFLTAQIKQKNPDLLFCIQRDIREILAMANGNDESLPTLTFITDPVVRIDHLKGNNDYIVSWSASMAQFLKKHGYKNVKVLPMMADSFEEGQNIPQIRSEVSFFGNYWSGGPREREARLQFYEERQPGLKQYAIELIDRFVRHEVEGNIYEVLETYPPPSGTLKENPKSFLNFILTEATADIRIRTLEQLTSFDLKIFGHGWKKSDASKQLQSHFYPNLQIKDQPHIFSSSIINLNIANPAHWGAPTNRYFNIPASGALELCEWSEGMNAFLLPGREMLYFNNPDDIANCVSGILSRRRELSGLIAAARNKIKEKYTYAQWIEELFNGFSE